MDISLSFVRDLGNKKLNKKYKSLYKTLGDITTIKSVRPYSFIGGSIENCYDGLSALLLYLDVDDSCNDYSKKREFKNLYKKIIGNYAKVNNLSRSDIDTIETVGLCQDIVSNNKELLEFYNFLLVWGVVTNNNKSVQDSGYTVQGLIHMLVLDDISTIVKDLRRVL